MSFNIIKTCHKRSFPVLLLLNRGILETKHKCITLLSTALAWIFNYFHVRLLALLSPIKKEISLILENSGVINYTPY